MRAEASSRLVSRGIDLDRIIQIMKFHVPLGLTTTLIASSISIVNAGFARTASPEIALAAYAVGHTVVNVFASPIVHAQQLLVIFGKTEAGWANAKKVLLGVSAAVLGWIALMAFTPLGSLIYLDLFGAPASLMDEIALLIRICLFLPLVYALRASANASLMLQRRTSMMTTSLLVRLAVMFVMTIFLPRTSLPSIAVGTIIWVGGIGVQALAGTVFAATGRSRHVTRDEDEDACSIGDCLSVLWPLVLNGSLMMLTLPVINAGLSRTVNPERSLAVFQVAWNLAWMFVAFIQNNFRQTVVVFLENAEWLEALKKVSLWIQSAVSGLMFLLVITGGADFIMLRIIGVDADLVTDARVILLILSAFPFLCGMIEYRAGIAMRARNVGVVGLARVMDLLLLLALVFAGGTLFPTLGASMGPLGMVVGAAGNYAVLRLRGPEKLPGGLVVGEGD
ncbi:MAG: hypothetical protein ACLFS8_02945 [Clostridia bacterium]